MSWVGLSAFVAFLANMGIGLVVLVRSHRLDRDIYFTFMIFCLAAWGAPTWLTPWLTQGLGFSLPDHQVLLLFQVSYIPGSFIPSMYLIFILRLIEHPTQRVGWIALTISGIFAALSFATTWVIAGIRLQPFHVYEVPGPLYPAFMGFIVGCLSYGFWLVWKAQEIASPQQRNQLRYVLVATGGGVGALAIYVLAAYHWNVPPVYFLIEVGIPLVLAYAIIKHQLMDIKVAITRTALLLATYFVVLGGPIGLCLWGREWLEAGLGEYWWAVPVGLSTALATMGPVVYGSLRRRTEELLRCELDRTKIALAIDALTGTLTRRALFQQTKVELTRAQQRAQPCSLLMIDLDHFKQKNDTHGHLVGDAVLQETATRLGRTLRGRDLLGRYGGEEFLLMLPATDRAEAKSVAERLRELVAGEPMVTEAGALSQTLSIGVATFPKDGTNLETLIARADQALYGAKRSGRNRVACA